MAMNSFFKKKKESVKTISNKDYDWNYCYKDTNSLLHIFKKYDNSIICKCGENFKYGFYQMPFDNNMKKCSACFELKTKYTRRKRND